MMSKRDNKSLVPVGGRFLPNMFHNIAEGWNNLSTGDKFAIGGMGMLALTDFASKFFGGFFENRYRMDVDWSKKKFSLCPSDADDESMDS